MQEILAYLARVRTDVAACVEGNPSEAFARRPREDAWSGSQIIYHLGNVEGATSKMLEGLFARGLAGGMPMDVPKSSQVANPGGGDSATYPSASIQNSANRAGSGSLHGGWYVCLQPWRYFACGDRNEWNEKGHH